jgi:rare lipoprotein A
MNLIKKLLFLAGLGLALAGCSSYAPRHGGGYYLDDGPGDNPPANLASIPDAVPKAEPLIPAANRPYTVLNKTYTPLASVKGYKEKGLASWYGRRYHGKPTSSGVLYDMYAMTAAHATLPIPSYVRVTNLKNNRSVVVHVIDRGPFHDGRIIDLSYTAAWKLDILKGVTPVEVVGIDPSEPSQAAAATPATTTSSIAPVPAATLPTPVPSIAASTPLPPLVEPIAPVNSNPAPANRIYLQLGAFSSQTGADKVLLLVQERIGTRLPATQKLQVGDRIKVQMGPFTSAAEAEQAAQKLEQDAGIHSFKILR